MLLQNPVIALGARAVNVKSNTVIDPQQALLALQNSLLMGLRILPLVILVPAFGLRALPLPVKVAFSLALALAASPVALLPLHPEDSWIRVALLQLLQGLPIAIGTASLLWAATMAGDVLGALRSPFELQRFAGLEGEGSAFGVLFSLLASLAFFELGGPARVVRALSMPAPDVPYGAPSIGALVPLFQSAVQQVTQCLYLAVAIAAPLVAVVLVMDVIFALVVRAAVPVALGVLIPAVRSVALLFVFGLLFNAVAWALTERIDLALPGAISTP
ncbi:MAG TPA: flagellar biosynthetic protein FliR [Polyangiaceae bacterium]|nr:flagellar biosynthetic protein FliR [Polyangiaceae bacterium]